MARPPIVKPADTPAFQRQRNPKLSQTEVRLQGVAKVLVDYIDARTLGTNMTRTQYVVNLIKRDAKAWAHEHIVAQRVLGGNSAVQELAGMELPEDED